MQVSIHQEDFKFTEVERQLDFLREMYNLTTKITELSRDFNPSKQNKLTALNVDAKNVLLLTPAHGKMKTASTMTIETDEEGYEREGRPQDEDDLGLFKGEDIQSILQQMNCRIKFILWGA